VRHTFFNPQQMKQAFLGDPSKGLYSVGKGLILNIEMFLIAEVLILFCALVIAVLRQLRNPVLFRSACWLSSTPMSSEECR